MEMKQVEEKKPTFTEQRDENMFVWLGLERQLVAIQRERVEELVIKDKATLEQAVEIKRDVRERKARILEAIKPYKVRLDEIKKQVLDVEKSLSGEYAKVEEHVVQKINDHLDALLEERLKNAESTEEENTILTRIDADHVDYIKWLRERNGRLSVEE